VILATTDAFLRTRWARQKDLLEFMVCNVNFFWKLKTLLTSDWVFSEIPLPATPSKQVTIAEPKESEFFA
jgi:hypothetical protein